MAGVPISDNERVLCKSLKIILQDEGFEVRTDRDGDEALKKIAEKRLDLILLDVMMLRMNGFRTCEEIRRCGSHSADHLPLGKGCRSRSGTRHRAWRG